MRQGRQISVTIKTHENAEELPASALGKPIPYAQFFDTLVSEPRTDLIITAWYEKDRCYGTGNQISEIPCDSSLSNICTSNWSHHFFSRTTFNIGAKGFFGQVYFVSII